MYVRQRQDRLRGDAPLRHQDRQLAAPARDDLTRHEDVVAEIDELLPRLQRLLADDRERHHRLNAAAVAGLQGRKAQLARVAGENDTAGNSGGHPRLCTGLKISKPRAQFGNRVGDRNAYRVSASCGIRPDSGQPLPLREPDRFLIKDLPLRGFDGRLR